MALLAMVAIVVMGVGYMLASRLNAASRFIGIDREHNARVLNQAKQALIGWVAINAAQTDNNPGRLPCPEAVNSIGTDSEGISAPQISPATPNCATVGRLPWRTLGLDKLVDAAAEPLWYVVSPGWALQNSSTLLTINSNSTGQLLVNARSVSTLSQTAGLATAISTAHGFRTGNIVKIAGAAPAGYNVAASVTFIDANTFTFAVDPALSTPAAGSIKAGDAAVALIIAPGPAMKVAVSADCPARSQARSVPAPTINALDYLECYDEANSVFSTTGPAASFNNQVLSVTTADVLPALEAAVAHRAQREIVPVLRTVYTWSQYSGVPASTPLYPYAAPFANPGPGAGTSSYQGVSGTYQGLLPFNQTQGCTASASNPRCLPSLVAYAATPADAVETLGYGYIETQSCSWEVASDVRLCAGKYHEYDPEPWRPIRLEMTATFTNVVMGLRALDATRMQVEARNPSGGSWAPAIPTYTATINDGSVAGRPRGSVTITFGATMPNIDAMGWGNNANFRIRLERTVIGDHFLLDPATTGPGAATGWYVRNEWYRLFYYAAAQQNTADGLPSLGCTTNGNCLRLNNPAFSYDNRALLILAGRSLSGTARPNNVITDHLEFQNNDGGTLYEQHPVRMSKVSVPALNAPWNDRVLVVDKNP